MSRALRHWPKRILLVVLGAAGACEGSSNETAAMLLNIAAGGLAAVLIAWIVKMHAGESEALRAVTLWSFFPTSFLLQTRRVVRGSFRDSRGAHDCSFTDPVAYHVAATPASPLLPK